MWNRLEHIYQDLHVDNARFNLHYCDQTDSSNHQARPHTASPRRPAGSQPEISRPLYILDFLCLSDSYSEKDIETAILAELQRFILKLRSDFSFKTREELAIIDTRDYYINLLSTTAACAAFSRLTSKWVNLKLRTKAKCRSTCAMLKSMSMSMSMSMSKWKVRQHPLALFSV